jgi:hypothetical protein
MSRRRNISIRVLEEVDEAVKRAAADTNRSTSNWIECALVATLVKDGLMPAPVSEASQECAGW